MSVRDLAVLFTNTAPTFYSLYITNMAAGRITQPGGLWVLRPCYT